MTPSSSAVTADWCSRQSARPSEAGAPASWTQENGDEVTPAQADLGGGVWGLGGQRKDMRDGAGGKRAAKEGGSRGARARVRQ